MATQTQTSYASRAAARKGAARQGLDLATVEIVEIEGRFNIQPAATNDVEMVILASEDADFGLVPAEGAEARAQELANEHGFAVMGRDPVSDDLLFTCEPVAPEAPKAPKAKGAPRGRNMVRDGKRVADGKPVSPKAEKAPKARKARKAAKAPKAPKAPAEKGDKAPKGMVVQILTLAGRVEGVTPAELNALTNWKGAPWRWLFSNWQGTGYCDRWGYNLEIIKGEGRKVSYRISRKVEAETEAEVQA